MVSPVRVRRGWAWHGTGKAVAAWCGSVSWVVAETRQGGHGMAWQDETRRDSARR